MFWFLLVVITSICLFYSNGILKNARSRNKEAFWEEQNWALQLKKIQIENILLKHGHVNSRKGSNYDQKRLSYAFKIKTNINYLSSALWIPRTWKFPLRKKNVLSVCSVICLPFVYKVIFAAFFTRKTTRWKLSIFTKLVAFHIFSQNIAFSWGFSTYFPCVGVINQILILVLLSAVSRETWKN